MRKHVANKKDVFIMVIASIVVQVILFVLLIAAMSKSFEVMISVDSLAGYCDSSSTSKLCELEPMSRTSFWLSFICVFLTLLTIAYLAAGLVYFKKIIASGEIGTRVDNKPNDESDLEESVGEFLLMPDKSMLELIDALYDNVANMESGLTKYKYGKCLLVKNALVEKYIRLPVSTKVLVESVNTIIESVESICPLLFTYEDLEEVITDVRTIEDVSAKISIIKKNIENFVLETKDISSKLV